MRKVKTLEKVAWPAPDVVTKIIPSPTDGWDAISPLAEMDPKRAPILINWVPRPGYVELRGGFIPWASVGSSIAVETLMVYRSSTTEKMFAAAGSGIWDVSIAGTATSALTGLSSSRWQWLCYTPGGGTTVLQAVNGTDTLRQFDGTVWTVPGITGITGGTGSIIHIHAQKRRLWYIINASTIAYFMPTDAITGPVAGSLDLGALWTKGGYLMAMQSWTVDGGSGPQDYALFISSRGQATIYAGTNPADANSWSLIGTFDLAPPIGRRCMLRVGSDVGIITQQGVLPISQALPFDPSADRSVAITARIQNAMATAAQTAQNNFGWQLISFPAQQLAILNVPITEGSAQRQYVMNALTGGWCQFVGWEANCFAIYSDMLFWGGNDGRINQGYTGGLDSASSISADMQCAFNWLDEPGRTKRMTMVQPLLTLSSSVTPTLAVDTDFATSTATAPVTVLTSGVVWDTAVWDTSVWPGITVNYNSWLSVNALGHAMALRMRVNIQSTMTSALGAFDVGQFDLATFEGGLTSTIPVLQVNAFNSIAEMGGFI